MTPQTRSPAAMRMALASLVALTLSRAVPGAAALDERKSTASIRIAPRGERGDMLVMTGRIADYRGRPVPGATLYVYHADAMGEYSKPGESAPRLSGTVRVGADGTFRIETVVPSHIKNVEGGLPHIHGTALASGRTTTGFVVNLTLAPGRHLDAAKRAAMGGRNSMNRTIYQDVWGTWHLVYDPMLP